MVREYESDFQRLPIFAAGPIRIPFRELFLVIAFIKSYIKGSKVNLILQRIYLVFIFYFILLFFFSIFLGMSMDNIIRTILHIIPFTLFITIPRLFKNNEENYHSFLRLVLSGIIVIVASQLFDLIAGVRIGDFFKGSEIIEDFVISAEEDILRLIYSPFLNTICVLSAFIFISLRDKTLTSSYINITLVAAFLSIFLSATRGWIISYMLMITTFMIFHSSRLRRTLSVIFIALVFIGAIYQFIPNIKIQTEKVFDRLQSLELIIKGDITAGGTLSRVTERAPRVWIKFLESPVWGFGISDTYYKHSDAHVGHHNILLQSGIVGYFLFLYFWIKSNYLIFITRKRIGSNNRYRSVLPVFYIIFLGVFIIHSTSTQMFGFTEIGGDQVSKIFLLAVYYSSLDFYIKKAYQTDTISSGI